MLRGWWYLKIRLRHRPITAPRISGSLLCDLEPLLYSSFRITARKDDGGFVALSLGQRRDQ